MILQKGRYVMKIESAERFMRVLNLDGKFLVRFYDEDELGFNSLMERPLEEVSHMLNTDGFRWIDPMAGNPFTSHTWKKVDPEYLDTEFAETEVYILKRNDEIEKVLQMLDMIICNGISIVTDYKVFEEELKTVVADTVYEYRHAYHQNCDAYNIVPDRIWGVYYYNEIIKIVVDERTTLMDLAKAMPTIVEDVNKKIEWNANKYRSRALK